MQNHTEAITAAHVLLQQGVTNVLVTLGDQGVFLVNAHECLHQACFQVANVVDTTGAGDCFRAIFAALILQGKSHREALLWATGASALCIQKAGAIPSIPTYEAVKQFLEDRDSDTNI